MIREFVSKIPQWLEIIFVIALCFGVSICSSIYSFTSGIAFTKVEFTDGKVITTLILELILTVVCLAFLRLRNYKISETLKFTPTIKATLLAVGLFALTYLVYGILFNALIILFGRENLSVAKYTVSVKLPLVFAVSLINPIFEETFVLGYIFDKFKANGVWLAIIISTGIRMSYHLYQGWIGVISILSMGVIFAVFYSRNRNLWAFYLSHALMDFTGLMAN